MNLPVAGIAAMVILMIAIAAAGCTDATARTPEAADVPAVKPAPVPAAVTQIKTTAPVPSTPACANPPLNPWWGVPESYVSAVFGGVKTSPASGTLVSKADLYGTPTHTWEEYATVAQIQDLPRGTGITRNEISREDYNGKPAVHERITSTLHLDGTPPEHDTVSTTDIFYDEFHAILSEHTRSVSGTGATTENDGPPDSRAGKPDCSGRIFVPMFTYVGTESLTVPAGTFPDARKYTLDIADDPMFGKSAMSTHWYAPGVPAELKRIIEGREKGVLMTRELTGWGGTMK
jgi:hypothetical protein